MTMTTEEMLALCEAAERDDRNATAGPWWESENDGTVMAGPIADLGGEILEVGDCDFVDEDKGIAMRSRTREPQLAAAVRQLVKERDGARQATRDAWSAQHHALDLASDRAVKIENAIAERDEARRLGLEATQYALDLDGRDDVVERLHEIRTALEGK